MLLDAGDTSRGNNILANWGHEGGGLLSEHCPLPEQFQTDGSSEVCAFSFDTDMVAARGWQG